MERLLSKPGNIEKALQEIRDQTTKLDAQQFSDLVDKVINPSTLKHMTKKYNLDSEQVSKLKRLSSLVPLENMEILLKRASNKAEAQKLLNTFYNADDTLARRIGFIPDKWPAPSRNIYGGKADEDERETTDFYSFSIDPGGQFYISFEKLDEGKNKKVSNALNLSNLEEVVKVTIKTEKNIETAKLELELQESLYNQNNSYINKPNKVTALTTTRTGKHQGEDKFVYFAKKREGDGLCIKPHEIKNIAQFSHDFAKGLSYMHAAGYVHGDVKSENSLLVGNRALLNDFETTIKSGGKMKENATLSFTPPENISSYAYGWFNLTEIDATYDSFSMGCTILDRLDPNYITNPLSKYNKQEDFKTYFSELREQVNVNDLKLSEEDKQIKLKLIEIAEKLTALKKGERISCAEAAAELAKIPSVDASDPVV